MLLRSLKEITGYKMKAKDGELGKVSDFYFDDENWIIRYAVDKTGFWLFGQQVLISPYSFEKPDTKNKLFPVSLTKEQIKGSPPIEADKPVSKEKEIKLTEYYRWPVYWSGSIYTQYPPQTPLVGATRAAPAKKRDIVLDKTEKEGKLRSMQEVTGYTIVADNKEIGYVKDFIVDDETWEIRYMVLDTKSILKGKNVIIAPEWINWIGWSEHKVSVDLNKEKIEGCPDFDISLPIDREYEEALYEHYNCPKYWMKDKE